MPRRQSAPWTAWESQMIVAACTQYDATRPDYEAIARALNDCTSYGRTAEQVKYRWHVLRDLARRRIRRKVARLAQAARDVPYQGQLHSSLVWVETQWGDIETIRL